MWYNVLLNRRQKQLWFFFKHHVAKLQFLLGIKVGNIQSVKAARDLNQLSHDRSCFWMNHLSPGNLRARILFRHSSYLAQCSITKRIVKQTHLWLCHVNSISNITATLVQHRNVQYIILVFGWWPVSISRRQEMPHIWPMTMVTPKGRPIAQNKTRSITIYVFILHFPPVLIFILVWVLSLDANAYGYILNMFLRNWYDLQFPLWYISRDQVWLATKTEAEWLPHLPSIEFVTWHMNSSPALDG